MNKPQAGSMTRSPREFRARRVLLVVLAFLLVAASCAGGDAGTSPFVVGGAGPGEELSEPADDGPTGGVTGSDGGVTSSDRITLDTGPATAYAEVNGERFVYEAVSSLNYTCEISPDAVRVNFQTPDGQDLSVQAGLDDIGWSGQFTFRSRGEFNTQYSVSLGRGPGTLGVVDGALSFEGVADRIENFDVLDAEEVSARVAVDCGESGEGADPMAVVDGETFTFPLSGSQSVDCAVSSADIGIMIDRLGRDGLQLSIDMSGGPDDWIGSVFVITPDGDYIVSLSGEAEGFVIDGNTVTYAGPIGTDRGGEVETNVAVTCP